MFPMYSLAPTPAARRPTPEERPEHCSNSVPILLKSSHPRSIRVPNPLRSAPECPEAHIRNGTKWNRMEHFFGVAPPGPAPDTHALPPVTKGRAGRDQRHLPYRDYACRLLKAGCAEGRSPFAGSLRVSLRFNSALPWKQGRAQKKIGRVLPQPASGGYISMSEQLLPPRQVPPLRLPCYNPRWPVRMA